MLKSKRKLIDIRLLPMAHLAIKIEAINNFHVAHNLCITLARTRTPHIDLIVYLNARRLCVFAKVIIRLLLNFFQTTCTPDLISAIFRQLITILQARVNSLHSGNTRITNSASKWVERECGRLQSFAIVALCERVKEMKSERAFVLALTLIRAHNAV